MAERFNRRLAEALDDHPRATANAGKNRFDNHPQRNAFIHAFVNDYNRTRLRCLGHKAPAELLTNVPGHNTKAGIHAGHGLRFHVADQRIRYRPQVSAERRRDGSRLSPGKRKKLLGGACRGFSQAAVLFQKIVLLAFFRSHAGDSGKGCRCGMAVIRNIAIRLGLVRASRGTRSDADARYERPS